MYAIGVDIGGTKIAAGVVDSDGLIVATTRRDTVAEDVTSIDQAIADVFRELTQRFSVNAVGLAAAGFIGPDRDTVVFAPNIAWRDYPLAARVAALIDQPEISIVVENDANAAGWAEFRFGAGRGATDMVMLTVGTGLGGAVVANGALVRGRWGAGAEVGHMRVVPEGHQCGCGLLGCWEQYASGSALVRDARAAIAADPVRGAELLSRCDGDPAQLTGPDITAAAVQGDSLSVALLAGVGAWLGEGAATVAALLDPEILVVGGGVGAAGELLLGPARKSFSTYLSAQGYRPEALLVQATHGNEAGMIGAADLARR